MSRKSTKEEFEYKSNIIHNNRYDYSLVEYVNNSTKINIICPVHGEFKQIPNSHLLGKGCKKCGVQSAHQKQSKTLEEYTNIFQKVHGDKYDYSKLEKLPNRKVNILCKNHGYFIQPISDHKRGHGCPKCGDERMTSALRDTLNIFVEKAKKKYEDKYDYSKVFYVNQKTKVVINCKTHGDFQQTPNNHLQGAGCPKCSIEFNSYIRSSYIERMGNRKVKIYLIECNSDEEKFLKLGITVGKIKNRYAKSKMPYNYEVITYSEDSAETIYDLEQYFRSNFKSQRYSPNIKFNGYTECYDYKHKEEIIELIKNKLTIK